MNIYAYIIFCLFPMSLCAEIAPIDFQQLSKHQSVEEARALYHQKNVSIRGFLYKAKEGQLILASEPNLKTCCIGSPHKIWQQITLIDELESIPEKQAVTIEGTIVVNPSWDSNHKLKSVFEMENAHLISKSSSLVIPFKRLIMGLCALAIAIYFGMRSIKKRSR
jgi:hypothetical protein